MKPKHLLLSTIVLVSLSACSATSTPPAATRDYSASGNGASCNADALKSAVGTQHNANVAENLQQRAGAYSHRVIRPNAHYTTDYDPDRLNIRIDETATILNVYCG